MEELKAELLVQGSKDAEAALEALKASMEKEKQAALDKLAAEHDAETARLRGAQGEFGQQVKFLKSQLPIKLSIPIGDIADL